MIRTPIENPIIKKAAEAAVIRLKEDYKINLLGNHVATYTVFETVLDEIFKALKTEITSNSDKDMEDIKINLGDLITVGVTNRESDIGEKSGNITLLLEASPNAKLMFKNDSVTEADTL